VFDTSAPTVTDGALFLMRQNHTFSPCFLWTGLPLQQRGETLIEAPLRRICAYLISILISLTDGPIQWMIRRMQQLKEGN